MNKKIKVLVGLVVAGLLVVGIGKLLWSQKVAVLLASGYEKQGIDVSHFQGEIDWPRMEAQGISFAYIKATEGSGYVDSCLEANYQGVKDTGIEYGFYHFLSLESAPETQMENYKAAVDGLEMSLVPGIDIEWYGDMRQNPPDKEVVLDVLRQMASLMEEEYGQKPVVYTTQTFYLKYFAGEDLDFPLWIRNVYFLPFQDWTVWQYTDRAVMDGYNGEEKYIDCDVIKWENLEMIRLKAE